MTILVLATREFWSNKGRNAVFGAILLISVATQMFAALSQLASTTAVYQYGTAVFGYAQTWAASVDTPLAYGDLAALNARIAVAGRSYAWFRPVTAVDVAASVRVDPLVPTAQLPSVTVRAVSADYPDLTPAVNRDVRWRTITSARRLTSFLLLDSGTARRVGADRTRTVDLVLDGTSSGSEGSVGSGASVTSSQGAPSGAPITSSGVGQDPQEAAVGSAAESTVEPVRVTGLPILGTFTERNKSLAVDVVTGQQILRRDSAARREVRLLWRCDTGCGDYLGLLQSVLAGEGLRLVAPQRIDQVEQFRPVLRELRRSGERFSLVVLALGGLAVTIVSSAFVEIRSPRFTTLRTLGASRPAVAFICLWENLLTAALVGAAAVVLGWLLTRLDPDRLNQIPEIRIEHLEAPVGVYARTLATTIVIGLVTGLLPALRAYRTVRAS